MMITLDASQKSKVTEWIHAGLRLSEIQDRLASEFGLRLTYMDVRFLIDDLKLVPKDSEPPKAPAALQTQAGQPGTATAEPDEPPDEFEPETAAPPAGQPGGKVSVNVDTVARPGALASGNVTFSDGQSATWYLDEYGRMGLAPKQRGYRPNPVDVDAFQMQLQRELQKLGY